MEKIESIIAEIEKLSVIELADLVKAIEEKFGVSAAAAAVVVAGGAAAGAAAEEKTADAAAADIPEEISFESLEALFKDEK